MTGRFNKRSKSQFGKTSKLLHFIANSPYWPPSIIMQKMKLSFHH